MSADLETRLQPVEARDRRRFGFTAAMLVAALLLLFGLHRRGETLGRRLQRAEALLPVAAVNATNGTVLYARRSASGRRRRAKPSCRSGAWTRACRAVCFSPGPGGPQSRSRSGTACRRSRPRTGWDGRR
jgi:hypothetical protein